VSYKIKMSKLSYIISDIQAVYPKSSLIKKIIGVILNPSIHAVILIRLALASPKPLFILLRLLLISKHSIDISPNIKIGRSLLLPHPISIVIGSGVVIQDMVTIYQSVTIGQISGRYPIIGNNVRIYPNSVIVGGIKIYDNAIIRALSFVDSDVEYGEIYDRR